MKILKDVGKAALPGLAEAGTSFLIDQLFSGSTKEALAPLNQAEAATRAGFEGGGLTGGFNGGRFNVKGSKARSDLIEGGVGTLNEQARAIAQLRDQFGVGVSDLREGMLEDVQNNQTRTVSDLRDSLSRRKIGGSSFASDAIARAQNEFNQQRSRIGEQVGLVELQAQSQLISQQYQAYSSAYGLALSELNLQGDAALQLSSKGQAALTGLAQLQSELLSDSSAGTFEQVNRGLQKATRAGIGAL